MSPKTGKQTKKLKGNFKGKSPQKTPKEILTVEAREISDSENSDVDEQGMEKLIAALGEDGLDDIAQHMLKSLANESEDEEDEEDDSDEEIDTRIPKVQARAAADSDESESDDESYELESNHVEANDDEGEKDVEDVDEDAIELDDVSSVDEDAVPRQKVTVDNKEALKRIRDTIKLDASLPWTETLTTMYPATHDVDVSNDLDRELSFYKQALYSADAARTLAISHSLPFTRPPDYFAEMVKSDAHMERIRQRLLDEGATIKKGEEKRREREGKKFGKQIQVEKLRERERSKKELDEKIKGLKRKRKGGALDDPQREDFDVALEDAITDRPAKRPRMPRESRDAKYGRGGRGSKGWRAKQNTRESTDQFDSGPGGRGSRGDRGGRGGRGGGGRGGSGRGGGAGRGTKRLGKSRRISSRGK